MKIQPIIKTLWWERNRLYIIDQRLLPYKEKTVELKNIRDVWYAIRNLSIRGAPAIGCVAAYGVALSALKAKTGDRKIFAKMVEKDIKYLAASRPTAYNLFFALGRIKKVLSDAKNISVAELKKKLISEAGAIYGEDLK